MDFKTRRRVRVDLGFVVQNRPANNPEGVSCVHAAIDIQRRAGDVSGIGSGQERDRPRYLLRPAEAAERRPGFLVLRALPGLRVQLSVDRPGLKGIQSIF
jgi:hypothetical protein